MSLSCFPARRPSTHELATVTLRHVKRGAGKQFDEDGNEITLNHRELGGHRTTWEYSTSIKKCGTISFKMKSRVDGEKKVEKKVKANEKKTKNDESNDDGNVLG